ncbi:MAG: hypothetical protein D6701_01020 [Gemmatimonadetes bacterium]|nr:MAG: hypothetical protein D6701_01020 [Gemmatimonadota bacterium]
MAKRFLAVAALLLMTACAAASTLPQPRSLIVRSGARLQPDPARMEAVDIWFREEVRNIEEDPSFLISAQPVDEPVMPWEGLTISGDTAEIQVQRTAPDAVTVYNIYAHLKLMQERGELGDWLPGGDTLSGYQAERAIVARVAEAWLYGRSVFDLAPYQPMDELVYAAENGYLDAYLLTARADEFREERRRWLDEDPDAQERYRAWFRETFETDPPGLR